MRQLHFDLLVIGAGPVGLAAAHAAAQRGAKVGLVDAQPRAGGQVWGHDLRFDTPAMAHAQIQELQGSAIHWLLGHEVVAAEAHCLVTAHAHGMVALY